MPTTQAPRFFRLLLVEDDEGRVQDFRAWLPSWARLVWAQSAGGAIGLIRRDPGRIYGGVLLDHDLAQRAMTEDDASLSGTDVALALIEHFSIDIPILIHSTNQTQVPRVARQLEEKGFWVTRIPFYDLREETFVAWLEEARDLWEELGDG
jgi:hypothetical protein